MTAFLHQLAQALLKEHGTALRDVAVVLPSQRAGLYLRKWLAQVAGQPLWSPQVFTIGSFMEELSGLRPLANEELLFEGYEAYRTVEGDKAQSLDDFLQWGATTLADISEADAHLVPLESYYRDLRAWEEIEWTFNDKPLSQGQERMVRFWAMVGKLHTALNEQLKQIGAGTTGLIERTAVERMREYEGRWNAVWLAGLNALTPAHEAVLHHFKDKGMAHFAWDADHYYMQRPEQEAGEHLRKAMGYFGKGILPLATSLADTSKQVEAVRAPNDVAQAWVAAELLKGVKEEEQGRTAIVLADEGLLQPLLEALPAGIGPLNITMGLPMGQLPVGSFVDSLHRLYTGMRPGQGFFHTDLERFLGHPFLRAKGGSKELNAALKQVRDSHRAHHTAAFLRDAMQQAGLPADACGVFTDLDDVRTQMPVVTTHALAWAMRTMAGDGLASEQIYQASLVLKRVHVLLARYHHQLDLKAYASLFHRLMRSARIGFYGEPLAGVQVMGMLEARALDFERLIVVGAQEGVLPANTSERSFIPFELRRAHGMPLRDANDAVQAYNFLRMLQRAKQVTLTWAEGEEAQGPSRFILQLQHELFKESAREMPIRNVQVDMPLAKVAAVVIQKDEAVLQAMRTRLEKGLSPSALGDWLACPLNFHFRQVLRLRERDDFDVRIAPNVLGEGLHNAVEEVYRPLLGHPLKAESLEQEAGNIDSLLRGHLARLGAGEQLAQGQPMLQFHMAKLAAARFLRAEVQALRAEQVITVLEQEVDLEHELKEATEAIGSPVRIKGRMDRVDRADGLLRILDMKTGKAASKNVSLPELSVEALRHKDKRYAAQLLMYAWLYLTGHPEVDEVQAGLLPLQHTESNKPLLLKIGDRETVTRQDLPQIAELLTEVVKQMMDPGTPFQHNSDSLYCTFCLAAEN